MQTQGGESLERHLGRLVETLAGCMAYSCHPVVSWILYCMLCVLHGGDGFAAAQSKHYIQLLLLLFTTVVGLGQYVHDITTAILRHGVG